MGDFLLKTIRQTETKGAVQTTDQTPLGQQTQTTTRQANVQTTTQGAATVVKNDAQTTTQGAATLVQISKEDVGLSITFEIAFQNRNPVPPQGEQEGSGCP